jgi:pyruvate/2-oxoglutarate dehydrogenase complex dihydrolipoamide acyltransferase (E2) component
MNPEIAMQQPIRIDENLWRTAVAPEGVLEWWFRADGAQVRAGEKIAQVQIEGALHDVMAPVDGKLCVLAFAGTILDPGAVIGQVATS